MFIGSSDNTIGGTVAGSGNVISGNTGDGILIYGSGATGNLVEGNYIGTNAAGTAALANTGGGVQITGGATNNTIGGITATPGTGAGNVISGNGNDGIDIFGSGTTGNVVAGNLIGTDIKGANALPNAVNGLQISQGLDGQHDRRPDHHARTGAGNVISGNRSDGIDISDSGTTENVVAGNLIGTDITGSRRNTQRCQRLGDLGAARRATRSAASPPRLGPVPAT